MGINRTVTKRRPDSTICLPKTTHFASRYGPMTAATAPKLPISKVFKRFVAGVNCVFFQDLDDSCVVTMPKGAFKL